MNIKEMAELALRQWVERGHKEKSLEFFNGTAIIQHQDGSYFVFRNAAATGVQIEETKFVFIATEHCGYHFFFADDLERWDWFPDNKAFHLFES